MKRQNLVYKVRTNDETLMGVYLGVWAGDGTQYYDKGYRIKICCNSKDKKMIEFFKFVLKQLFGKTTLYLAIEERHRALLRFNSKFIYNFPKNYLMYGENKTHTVHLKNKLEEYSNDFLDGFLLGLSLTDGYLKEKFCFNVTSENLVRDVFEILKTKGLNPSIYIHDRKKYGWKDLHMLRLNRKESRTLLEDLNSVLKNLNYNSDFLKLKYEGE